MERYSSKSRWDSGEAGKYFKEYPQELQKFYEHIMNTNFASSEEQYQVGYFRKFNALHKYMCDLDHGRDECQKIFISREKLRELIKVLTEISECHGKAPVLLPTQDGFFFGSQEYNEWYFESVEEALSLFKSFEEFFEQNSHQLKNVAGEPVVNDDGSPYVVCDWTLVYQASW